jgi:exonuclease III
MVMTDINLISYNVKGLRGRIKRETIFRYLKEKIKVGIICLQETHSTADIHDS